MTDTDPKQERELPDGEQRVQVRAHRAIREYISERSDENNYTYSQQMAEWLPDDPDASIPGGEEDIVVVKLVPEVHQLVDALSVGRLRHSQVLAYYTMQAAIENGDIGKAAEFASYTPTTLLRAMQEGQADV